MRRLLPLLALLACCQPLLAASLSTGDGLMLSLGSDGRVTGLAAGQRKLPVTEGGGFYAIDVASMPTPTRAGLAPATPVEAAPTASPRFYLRVPLTNANGVLTQKGNLPELGLGVQAECTEAKGYISFSCRVQDLTGRDRAVEIGYDIPLQAKGWDWGDDITHSRRIGATGIFRTVSENPARPGFAAICPSYPFSSLADGSTGVSLGLPLAQGPRVYSTEYDAARQCLSVRFHFGLSKQVKKYPGQAWCSFLLYQHDGKWGFRSAADRYYHLFPADFEKRVPYEGYLGCNGREASDGTRGPTAFYGVPAIGDFGRGFPCLWQQDLSQAAPPLPTLEELDAKLQQWQREQPRAEPYTWCVSTDGTDPVGPVDLRPERLAQSQGPLTYDHLTFKPAVPRVGSAFNSEVLTPLARRYKFLVIGTFSCGDGGANFPFVDIGLISADFGGWGKIASDGYYWRTAAYRRPLRYQGGLAEGEKRAQTVREMLLCGLLYAVYPDLPSDAPQYRRLYQQFVPAIERLSAAGWEPVTLAHVTDPQVRVERYGRIADANLAFTVRNVATDAKSARLLLDDDLGLPADASQLEVRDLLTGEPVTPVVEKTHIILPFTLAAGESAAFSILPRHRQLQADLLQAADCLRQAASLNTTEEMSYQTSRPGELLVGDTPPSVRADTVLNDGWSSDQGLIFQPAPEPLSIKLDLNSPHRLQWLRLHYGCSDAFDIPVATVEGQDRDGNWVSLGKVAPSAATTAPLLDIKADGEYQFVRLTWPALTKKLWLKEIEVHGEDAALLRAAERFTTLAQEPSRAQLGLVGQLAIALRVRRMLGHDKTLQERALTYLSDFTSTATGLFVSLEVAPDAPVSGPASAQLTVTNRGDQTLREGSLKLKLPPGWSAAPTKLDVDLPPHQTVRLPVTLVRPGDDAHLTLLITGSVGPDAIFMSRWL